MKLKICGMVYPENINKISRLMPDYMGFIFYEKSPRFVADKLDREQLKNLPLSIKKIGVFVNASHENIMGTITDYYLDMVQLHGDETPEFCTILENSGVKIIKAFSIDENFDFNILASYKTSCEYFLFDAKGTNYGGNGISFNWKILKYYDNSKPFFLSGGIDIENIKGIEKYSHLNIHSLDINSKFEISPGLKDIDKIIKLLEILK